MDILQSAKSNMNHVNYLLYIFHFPTAMLQNSKLCSNTKKGILCSVLFSLMCIFLPSFISTQIFLPPVGYEIECVFVSFGSVSVLGKAAWPVCEKSCFSGMKTKPGYWQHILPIIHMEGVDQQVKTSVGTYVSVCKITMLFISQ